MRHELQPDRVEGRQSRRLGDLREDLRRGVDVVEDGQDFVFEQRRHVVQKRGEVVPIGIAEVLYTPPAESWRRRLIRRPLCGAHDTMVARPHAPSYMAAACWIAAIPLLLVPLAVMPDLLDRFHVIKESIMRTQAILGAFLFAVALAFGETARFRELMHEKAIIFTAAAGLLWTVITTLLSTARASSIDSLVSVATSALVFLVVWYAAPRVPLMVFDGLVPVVLINGVLAYLQEHAIYDPFVTDDPIVTQHLKATALIGNPNVVGSWMALASVLLAGASIGARGTRRWYYAFGAAAALSGVVVSETRTAIISVAAGLVLLAIGGSRKRAVVIISALALLSTVGIGLRVPVVMKVIELPRLVSEGTLEIASSGRVAPALAALEMFLDRPVLGVGPGAYGARFMEYKIRVIEQHPELVRGTTRTMFGDAHNDHLQMLAEAGAPGYALFLAFVTVVVLATRKAGTGHSRQRIAGIVALPLAATFLVLCLAQFPLHLAVTRHLVITAAGLIAGWSARWD